MFRSATLAERVTGHVLAGPHKGKSVVIELWILRRSTLTVIKLDSKRYTWLGKDLSYFNEAVSLIKSAQGGTMSLNEKWEFYREYTDYSKTIPTGNVVAIPTKDYSGEGFASVTGKPNSPVRWGPVGKNFLEKHCEPITEKEARKIHPRLFETIEKASC